MLYSAFMAKAKNTVPTKKSTATKSNANASRTSHTMTVRVHTHVYEKILATAAKLGYPHTAASVCSAAITKGL